MIVGKIWDSEYPWDVRVEKVTGALAAAGHEVHLFCRNRRGERRREQQGALAIHRMPNWPAAGTWLDDVSSFPAFMNPRWRRHVTRAAREAGVELLLCRDLPLAPLALRVGRSLGVPVVVDIAENYPAMLRHRFALRAFRPHNLVVRNPLLATLVERHVVRRADALLAVVEESRERLVGLGASPDRVELVSNTPTAERIAELGRIAAARRAHDGPVRLVYLGLLHRSRGVETVMRAMGIAKERGQSVRFDVIGRVDPEVDLPGLAASLGVSDAVRFHGHVPYDSALRIVADADVGVVPHHGTEHWRTTIPNKLFDYMAAELPVLVSDVPPVRRIVEAARCGVVFRDRDAADLADRLATLASPERRAALGRAGRAAVLSEHNWTADAARLVERIATLAPSRRRSPRGVPALTPEVQDIRSTTPASAATSMGRS